MEVPNIRGKNPTISEVFGEDHERGIREVHWKVAILSHQSCEPCQVRNFAKSAKISLICRRAPGVGRRYLARNPQDLGDLGVLAVCPNASASAIPDFLCMSEQDPGHAAIAQACEAQLSGPASLVVART